MDTKQSQTETQKQVDEEKQQHEEIQKQVDEEKQRHEQTQKQLNEEKQRHEQTQKQLNEEKQRHEQTQKQLNEEKQRHEQTQKQLNEEKQRHEQTQKQLNEEKQRHEQTQKQLNEEKQRHEQTQKQLNEEKQRHEQTQKQLNEEKQRHEQTQKQLNEEKQRHEQTQKQLNEEKQRHEQTQKQLNEEKQRHEQTQKQLNEEKQRHEQTQKQLKEEKQRHEQTQKQLNEEKQRHEQTVKKFEEKKEALQQVISLCSPNTELKWIGFVKGPPSNETVTPDQNVNISQQKISGAVVILSGDTSDGNKLLSDLFKVEIKSDSSSVLDYSILQIESSSSILLLEPSRKETLDPGQGILAQILKKEAPCCVFVQRSTSSTAGDSLRAEIRKHFSHIIVLHDLRQESSVDSAINKYKDLCNRDPSLSSEIVDAAFKEWSSGKKFRVPVIRGNFYTHMALVPDIPIFSDFNFTLNMFTNFLLVTLLKEIAAFDTPVPLKEYMNLDKKFPRKEISQKPPESTPVHRLTSPPLVVDVIEKAFMTVDPIGVKDLKFEYDAENKKVIIRGVDVKTQTEVTRTVYQQQPYVNPQEKQNYGTSQITFQGPK